MDSTSHGRRPRTSAGNKRGERRSENNDIYASPLPVLLPRTSPLCSLLGFRLTRTVNPHCKGEFDPATRSVWVTDPDDVQLLWRQGFFGKGNLSRSEPNWLARQKKTIIDGKELTAEQITAKRRAERQQFKLDRAKAIAEAAAAAEAAFAEGRIVMPALSGSSIPSAATWKPPPALASRTVEAPGRDVEEDPQEDIEHLQLTLPEAFFLAWALHCLTIDGCKSPHQMWNTFQSVYEIPTPGHLSRLRHDNVFLIHYVVYHHYRSLGWVVKGGIKFCVDYLLYKRGPVFNHAEFAVVICPVYEDPADEAIGSQNASPYTWSWLSTINRVNTQVQKTLILAYVTIPARARLSPDALSSPACLVNYSVREVVIRRFIPARMRD